MKIVSSSRKADTDSRCALRGLLDIHSLFGRALPGLLPGGVADGECRDHREYQPMTGIPCDGRRESEEPPSDSHAQGGDAEGDRRLVRRGSVGPIRECCICERQSSAKDEHHGDE